MPLAGRAGKPPLPLQLLRVMTYLLPSAACAAVLLFTSSTIAAQEVAPQPDARAPRWLVTLRDRSFDLTTFATARTAAVAPAAMDAVVADLKARARADQAPLAAVVADLGGTVCDQWWLVNGLAVELAADRVDALRAHPRVARIVRDELRKVGIQTSTNAANHATDLVQALGIRGEGVTVAIVDSGVDSNMANTGRPHATFYRNGNAGSRTGPGLQGSRLLANVQVGVMSPDDLIAHGTAVAGVAVGARWNSGGLADDGHSPEALVVSYSVADDAVGGAYASTLVRAWQQVAADALRFNIKVANCSYEGTFDLGFPDQTAIDELARTADVLVTGMAGNSGSLPGYGYGATNMLAVGACEHDTQRVAAFSTRGPAYLTIRSAYPDLLANGVAMTMPLADAEASVRGGQGTSYSAPQVAGAAALYRSIRPAATADQTRAAILASSRDVTFQQAPPDQNRNATGHGYLKVDALVHAALAAAITTTDVLSASQMTRSYPLPVIAGRAYGVAIAWSRIATQTLFSELELHVAVDGSTLSATTFGNHDEMLRFTARATGTATVTVRATRILPGPTQAFALVATEIPTQVVGGAMVSFGQLCHQISMYIPAQGAPIPGGRYVLTCQPTAITSAPVTMMIGASRTTYLGRTLPIDLTALGAPSCLLSIAPLVYVAVPINSISGRTDMTFPLPRNPSLVGAQVFHQCVAIHPTLNALGATTSNGIEVSIGGTR